MSFFFSTFKNMCAFNRDEVITALWASPNLERAINRMEPADLRDDLRQELFVELLRMPDSKLAWLHNEGKVYAYAIGIIRNMMLSNRGAFYNLHRRFKRDMYAIETDPADTTDQTDPLIEHIDATMAKMDWYESEMLKMYAEMGECLKVAEATGIPRSNVSLAVTNAKRNFKQIINGYAY